MVGVCATRFCATVDVVLEMMPAVVWALTGRWLWLEEDPPAAPAVTQRKDTHTAAFRPVGNCTSHTISERQNEQMMKGGAELSLVFKDVVCGLGRCAILFFSPE